ncbi:retinaldehyde-binding protein 1-like isoform X1 [Toxorhynchites rutilus septentrionalis]|uniref:retinaldehyde-binding protein 1-like isoform X1 n=1 Tax=Toxorhynchites rutilus septentrionalis TaxID=329112 RepID=UPI0024785AD7|nr:retinaldehyde-binding protein 1-like isoform X1 [Toxorhynchites rutilus septentrionalis]
MSIIVPGIDKCPSTYARYECKLDSKTLQIAKDELRESEATRDAAMAQLREFIAKHPQIQTCRTDGLFLLRYLRSTKFNVVAACEQLERYLTICETTPRYFKKIDPMEEQLRMVLDSRVLVPLGVDKDNRTVILFRLGELDPHKITTQMQIQAGALAIETLMEDEVFQVAGMVIIIDFQNTTMSHYSAWSMSDLKLIIEVVNDILSHRLKEIHLLQLPRYAAMVVDYCTTALSPSLKERMKFHKSLEEFKDAIDETILPTIYGGKLSLEEANERFLKRTLEERDRILKHTEMFIDLSIPNPNSKNSNAGLHSNLADESVIGSFRKLNVD